MTEGVTRLKQLLFESENQTLSELDRRLEDVLCRITQLEEESYGTLQVKNELLARFETITAPEHIRQSVVGIIDDVLHELAEQDRDRVAQAIAPLVIAAIQTELQKTNGSQRIAEVFHPVTGLILWEYFAKAFNERMQALNCFLERNFVMLRIRSLLSGKSVAELSITKSQHLRVEEIFLIQRRTDKFLAHWQADPPKTVQSVQDKRVSQIISEINKFVMDAFQSSDGHLGNFEVDGSIIFVRASPIYICAAKCSGVAPSSIHSIVDKEFLRLLERIDIRDGYSTSLAGPSTATHELEPFAFGIREKTAAIYAQNERAGLAFRPLKALVYVVAVMLVSLLVWTGYTISERSRVEQTAQSVIAGSQKLAGYPINIEVGYRGYEVHVSGLAPNKQTIDWLRKELATALPSSNIVTALTSLPNRVDIAHMRLLSRIRSDIETIENTSKRRSILQALQRTGQRITQVKLQFGNIRSRLKNGQQLSLLTEIEASLARIDGEVKTYTAIAKATAGDFMTLQNLHVPLQSLSDIIFTTAMQLAALSSENVQQIKPLNSVASVDVIVASEYLEAQSRLLMDVTVAVSHTFLLEGIEHTPPRAGN